ncbi:hypothetical protein CAPTEDRAFT_138663 [Capitella teleta]|uniref:RING finger protein 141 n=1 Tax=Capitella teleta TaxID=283909 RepID=R7VC04_CAPTE|nr:hypothetical protein CAPTEDRAFT_138663 [Capitella teleta]|eukprot:ELU16378.1 hypothetical protein CAPTEDRAFT_138663 [Capitella teleta]
MGQAHVNTLKENAPSELWLAQGTIQKHALEIKKAAIIPYEEFLQSVKELNEVTHSFSDINGKTLLFEVKKGSDTSVLWRGTVRVKCHKVNSSNGIIDSTRLLNLKQFIHLRSEIQRQARFASFEDYDLSTSVFLTGHQEEGEMSECCICMDRKAGIILPCAHVYCEQCIDAWNVNHNTCPICRARIEGSDDTWVLTEKPDTSEILHETTGYLMDLADRSGYATAEVAPPVDRSPSYDQLPDHKHEDVAD